ncbi:hypothetical protein jhhlp_001063 [Lomentospora prolificans]|uniref:N-acetyltransferase domain-containing protein n=1 Tax=Lomentospora prolificans TaxID=41688 RepID=A0A2N3NH56_9PEZI|nr:hypothetical protein jhhlp_001063 [Lomentospora prolificans]
MSSPAKWLSTATALAGIPGATWIPSPRTERFLARQRETERKKRMATPFLASLRPSNLRAYKRGLPRAQQSDTVPPVFLDAMEVREKVFVEEQGVPAENEFDADDSRSCHFCVYSSARRTVREEVRDDDGNLVQPRVSDARRVPAGTIRIVPFPHEPHPTKGAKYWGGKTEDEIAGREVEKKPVKTELGYFADRRTTFHNGQEPYVKLGRLAVLKEYRGQGLAAFLVKAAVKWLRENPNYFDPSVVAKGLARLDAVHTPVPQWKGLVCVHAQEQVADVWARWGFIVDEEMGTWWEEGIRHVGMFLRIDIDKPIITKKVIPVDFPGDSFTKMMKDGERDKEMREEGLGEAMRDAGYDRNADAES